MTLRFSPTLARRTRLLGDGDIGDGPVLYWMSREQRSEDHWPLLAAAEAAALLKRPLVCAFCFSRSFCGAQKRHYTFLVQGLKETESEMLKQNVKMLFLFGDPGQAIASLAESLQAALLVLDFDPLPEKRAWKAALLQRIRTPLYETDGHNIIPAWIASPKTEYSAATFRKKVQPLLPSFLEEFPPFPSLPLWERHTIEHRHTLEEAVSNVQAGNAGPTIEWIAPGASKARESLRKFLSEKLSGYDTRRNDPTLSGVSGLSPWLHFGQLSPQRVALEAMKEPPSPGQDAFLEELLVRRELADNFCLYEPKAGTYDGLPEWGRKTLALHKNDSRPSLYSLTSLERGETADLLWNAAQREMVARGKMHGWLRMYWAKKILEWTETPEEAFERALLFNDRYELDGRDPNGIAGVSWAIGGLHDRPWANRQVFGMIRYMNDRGAARKFKVNRYIEEAESLIATGR